MQNGFCIHCGTALVAGEFFCSHCGAGINCPQPGAYAAPPRVPDYLIWSIFTICCCNQILGIIALLFAVLSKSDLDAGRYDSAIQKSSIAFWCNVISLVLAVLIWGGVFIFFGLATIIPMLG